MKNAEPIVEASTPEQFEQQVFAERERQEAKGYTTEHDREHGIDHLLMWAIDYARRGERVKFAALTVAARELLAADAMEGLENEAKLARIADWVKAQEVDHSQHFHGVDSAFRCPDVPSYTSAQARDVAAILNGDTK